MGVNSWAPSCLLGYRRRPWNELIELGEKAVCYWFCDLNYFNKWKPNQPYVISVIFWVWFQILPQREKKCKCGEYTRISEYGSWLGLGDCGEMGVHDMILSTFVKVWKFPYCFLFLNSVIKMERKRSSLYCDHKWTLIPIQGRCCGALLRSPSGLQADSLVAKSALHENPSGISPLHELSLLRERERFSPRLHALPKDLLQWLPDVDSQGAAPSLQHPNLTLSFLWDCTAALFLPLANPVPAPHPPQVTIPKKLPNNPPPSLSLI